MGLDMADAQRNREGDRHNWNPLENYIYLHEWHLDEHPIVDREASDLTFISISTPDAPCDLLVVEGLIICRNHLLLEIRKSGDLERSAAKRVRMNLYSYNAYYPGGHNVLRYDNHHRGQEDLYHRHHFDPGSGDLIETTFMPREEFPVMHEILDELMGLVPLQR